MSPSPMPPSAWRFLICITSNRPGNRPLSGSRASVPATCAGLPTTRSLRVQTGLILKCFVAGMIALGSAGTFSLVAAESDTDDAVLGLVHEKPESGRFVPTDQGFMVPYTVTIPGTSATFTMQPVPGGTFKMGSPETEADRGSDEGPQVSIELPPFWIAQHETTWAEYQAFMNIYEPLKSIQSMRSIWDSKLDDPENRKKAEDLKSQVDNKAHLKALLEKPIDTVDAVTIPTPLYEPDFTYSSGQDPKLPAVTMSQYAAKQYTKWLSGITGTTYRLPCEAEWEYACRAGTTTAFSFGDDAEEIDQYAWYTDNADEATHLVGLKKPNPWGLYDMHGNAMEWVIDGYDASGYAHLDPGKTHQAAESVCRTDKLFPRVLRGGHWDDDAQRCRSAARLGSNDYEWYETDPNSPKSPWWLTDFPAATIGFRIVRPLAPLTADEKEFYYEADVEYLIEDVSMRLEDGRAVRDSATTDLPQSIKESIEVDAALKSER